MANPTFQANGTAASGLNAVTPAWPAHVSGDVALLFVETAGGEAATLSTAAGFVEVTGSPRSTGTGTAGTRLTVFWCRATSSSMPSPTVADLGDHQYAQILTYRGCRSTGDPFSATAGSTKGTASTTCTLPSVTTTIPDTLVVMGASRDADSAAAYFGTPTNANLTGIARRVDAGTTSGNGGGFGVFDGVKATAGATGSSSVSVSSSVNAMLTIALVPPQDPPTVTLNTADATSFATSTPTVEFTGTDADGDDISYHLQIHNAIELHDVGTTPTSAASAYNAANNGFGQSFISSQNANLGAARFYLRKQSNPTGNAVAKLYSHTGTFGTSSGLPNTLLATSDPLDVSTLTTSFVLTTLTFSGAQQVALTSGTAYFIVIEYASGDSTNRIQGGTASGHEGSNAVLNSGSWSFLGSDIAFQVFPTGITPTAISVVSSTHAGFANTVNGADTDPFTSGQKVSYTVQAGDALDDGTYSWRVRGIDPSGTNTYGDWSTARSLSVAADTSTTLVVQEAAHTHATESPALVQANTLSLADALQAHAAESPGMMQNYLLSAADALQAHTSENPTLTQALTLVAAESSHAQTADNTALVQAHSLSLADANHVQSVDGTSLTQAHTSSVAEALHSHSVEEPTLTQATTLAVVDAMHAQTAANTTLTQAHVLAVSEASQAHNAEGVALTQAHTLGVAEAAHSQSAENAVLSEAAMLTVSESNHAQSVDALGVTQHYLLSAQDTLHTQTPDAVELVQAHTVSVADSAHGQTVENFTLSEGLSLEVQESTHTQTSEAVALSQGYTLAVDESAHAQPVEAPALQQHYQMAVADASQAQTSENSAITTSLTLAVQESTQAHATDGVANLTQAHNLSARDARHTQAAEGATASVGFTLTVDDNSHAVTSGEPALLRTYLLSVQDDFHDHSVDLIQLSSFITLIVADVSQSHSVEGTSIRLPFGLLLYSSQPGVTSNRAPLARGRAPLGRGRGGILTSRRELAG